MGKLFEKIGKVDLICDDDGHITRTLSSFDIGLIQVINIRDTFSGVTLKRKARSSIVIPRLSFIKTCKNSCSKVTLRFGPGFSKVNSISGDENKVSVSSMLRDPFLGFKVFLLSLQYVIREAFLCK